MVFITLPFSKSEINRLMILSFQAKKNFVIHHFSFCDDTKVIYDFFSQIGVSFKLIGNDLHVDASNVNLKEHNNVQVHKAGTAFRFLLSLTSLLPYQFTFIGHQSLSKRPIAPLTNSLASLGIDYHFHQASASLPLSFHGVSNLKINSLEFKDPILSSQFISSILLLAPSLPLHFTLKFNANQPSSESYVWMTLQMLKKLGIIWDYSEDDSSLILTKNNFDKFEYTVSADWTNASYFIALSCILKKTIVLPNLSLNSFQPDVEQLFLWTDLGVQFYSENENDLIVNPSEFQLKEFQADFSAIPDLFQTFAVLTAYKQGTYHFSGLQTLQYKETHRLKAIQNELKKIGIFVEYDDRLGECTITNDVNNFPTSVFFNTYHDHRMAMALSLLKPLIPNIQFEDETVVNKSFPNFWLELYKLV